MKMPVDKSEKTDVAIKQVTKQLVKPDMTRAILLEWGVIKLFEDPCYLSGSKGFAMSEC